MAVPMAGCYCAEPLFPPFVINVVVFLSYINRAVARTLQAVGLGVLLNAKANFHAQAPSFSAPVARANYQQSPLPRRRSARLLSATSLVREALPCSTYECEASGGTHNSCTVCLHELQAGEEVRRSGVCRHVFHACCIAPWIVIGRQTCPLCRAQLVPKEILREAMIAAGKDISGHQAMDRARISSELASYGYYDDDLYQYDNDGDSYLVLQDEFHDYY